MGAAANLLDIRFADCYPQRTMLGRLFLGICFAGLIAANGAAATVALEPATSKSGYLARLLINEASFPGDPLYRSEEDTRFCMLEILWVLDNRIRHIPPGYTQQRVANAETDDIIDVITAPGQVNDFYRDPAGQFTAARRVFTRVDFLVGIANEGPPGRFGRLLNYAQTLARDYFESSRTGTAGWGEDRFAPLRRIGPFSVTGRAYAWMTSDLPYEPGGDFVPIPREDGGAPSGNRFYTLRRSTP